MKRIVVMGVSGSGKSTLARKLATRLDVPYVELDRLCHQPGWRESPDEDFRRDVGEAIAVEGWVVDGNYERKLGGMVFERADTIVWLDLPLPIVLARLGRRVASDYITQRDLYNGNRQTFRGAFGGRNSLIPYAVSSHFRRRREWPAKFAAMKAVRVVRLRSPREVLNFSDKCRPPCSPSKS
jgi:shikimate kinase